MLQVRGVGRFLWCFAKKEGGDPEARLHNMEKKKIHSRLSRKLNDLILYSKWIMKPEMEKKWISHLASKYPRCQDAMVFDIVSDGTPCERRSEVKCIVDGGFFFETDGVIAQRGKEYY